VAALGPITAVISLIKSVGTNMLTGIATALVNALGSAV